MALTDVFCRKVQYNDDGPKKQIYTDGGGMYFEVTAQGSRYWRLAYRFSGKQKVLALGVYPEISLSEARKQRDDAKKLLAQGVDPAQDRRIKKQQVILSEAATLEVVAREWHSVNIAKWTPRYATEILHRLEMDVFPLLGKRPISDISSMEMLDTLRQVEKRGALEIAKRLGQTCGQVFRYAIATGRADRNPIPDLKDALKPVISTHYAAFDVKELPDFLQKLERNDARLFPLTRLAIRLIMLTFVRTSELIESRWSEFDLDAAMWTIPAERMKMRRGHFVPLSRQALLTLAEIRNHSGGCEWVFPNVVHPTKVMSNNTILYALARLGYKGQMTGHGFRALAMTTIKEKLGYRHEVIDRQLAHAPKNKVDAAYDRALFLHDRTVMMQDWADYVDRLGTATEKA